MTLERNQTEKTIERLYPGHKVNAYPCGCIQLFRTIPYRTRDHSPALRFVYQEGCTVHTRYNEIMNGKW